MRPVSAALIDGQRLPRRLQVSRGGPWFVAGRGSFERVGAGDLSLADLRAVQSELGEGVFVALPLLRSLQEYLGGKAPGALKRFEQRRDDAPPTLNAVARAAQVAVLPKLGPVWVDGHRLFRPGETATLPWTAPRVELTVVRPSVVRSAMRAAIGPRGPRRAVTPPAG